MSQAYDKDMNTLGHEHFADTVPEAFTGALLADLSSGAVVTRKLETVKQHIHKISCPHYAAPSEMLCTCRAEPVPASDMPRIKLVMRPHVTETVEIRKWIDAAEAALNTPEMKQQMAEQLNEFLVTGKITW